MVYLISHLTQSTATKPLIFAISHGLAMVSVKTCSLFWEIRLIILWPIFHTAKIQGQSFNIPTSLWAHYLSWAAKDHPAHDVLHLSTGSHSGESSPQSPSHCSAPHSNLINISLLTKTGILSSVKHTIVKLLWKKPNLHHLWIFKTTGQFPTCHFT